ncbi:GPI ethanolamine phosphate transferase 3 like protein [Verticillium longisporum]|uniref:GPI ethanolamine phosphate transferase 3 like protein n=1 Tax=Verticillium longisporum TaxID=100787 RepID=A0A8I3AWP5_VERLO|nr:GPI ethanolamine phosphate transferase 3 like protein [Verticillium longisporum]
MAQPHSKQPAPSADYKTIAAEYARAKRAKEASDAAKQQQQQQQQQQDGAPKTKANASELQRKAFEARRKSAFGRRWWWAVGFWLWLLSIHAVGILLFTSGFLLTRMVLDEKSACAVPPVEPAGRWKGMGTVEGGCWHPKSFDKAVVVIIDALRYDFTVPVADNAPFHNAFPFLHETALRAPQNAFLRPFIADPPTATLQRLKGLTTGTLPTFIDAGSNFAGTAIEEDNLLMQMKGLGQRIVHIGDDTWVSLFPDYFEPNISRAYDSFNVWDLHTVDTGVIDHLAPLLQPENKGKWDVLIGHLLGVDHAGHRYGPDHPAMKAKLEQMDAWLRDLSTQIDDDTVLIVMGDHGMDEKGDHGGESDDEVEAALWMYSKRPFFGRTDPNHAQPPATGKERPVNQIDLVSTLALLLGIPIPFNNLGGPIEEAFAGVKGNDWANLAAVSRISAAGTQRYQDSYFAARGMESSSKSSPTHASWTQAHGAWATKSWPASYQSFRNFQEETLQVCKDLWARFDVPKMITGIIVMAAGVIMLLVYASRDEDEDFAATDIELDFAEKKLELQGIVGAASPEYTQLHKNIVVAALVGAIPGAFAGAAGSQLLGVNDLTYAAAAAAFASIVAALVALTDAGKGLLNILPTSVWGWLSVLFTVSQSVGFASNSYTIWEDSILLFFISTFGAISAVASFSIPSPVERTLAVYHSVLFIVLGRAASFSKLCREEQMPYCTSTYYASSSSSTSAGWQLLIPFVVAFALPAIIKSFLVPSRSWEGLGPTWIGYIYRAGLFMAALYWVLDAADNGEWVPGLPEQTLKTIAVYVAQLVLALVFVAGTTAFVWAPPLVSVVQSRAPDGSNKVVILGYGNTNGARYLLLPMNLLAGCILLSKPMGGGALALVFWQTMSLMEILDLNGLTAESIGPVMLALLGNFAYFKTGHQATPSSIQWDSAFIPLFTIRYPWTPIVVALNHFGAQIIAASAVPLVVLWKVGPKRKGVLESASRALAAFVSFFAVESLATMAWAGHLRRHLMLYRVFCPRFMMGAVLLLVVDLVCIVVTLAGVRSNTLSVSEVFGFAD